MTKTAPGLFVPATYFSRNAHRMERRLNKQKDLTPYKKPATERAFCCPLERRRLLRCFQFVDLHHAVFLRTCLPPQRHRLVVVKCHIYAVRFGQQAHHLLPLTITVRVQAVNRYGKRYTAGALLNFTTTGEDDDGQGANKKPEPPAEPVITAGQAAQLDSLLKKCSQVLQDNFTAKYDCAANVFKSEFDAVSARITPKPPAGRRSKPC